MKTGQEGQEVAREIIKERNLDIEISYITFDFIAQNKTADSIEYRNKFMAEYLPSLNEKDVSEDVLKQEIKNVLTTQPIRTALAAMALICAEAIKDKNIHRRLVPLNKDILRKYVGLKDGEDIADHPKAMEEAHHLLNSNLQVISARIIEAAFGIGKEDLKKEAKIYAPKIEEIFEESIAQNPSEEAATIIERLNKIIDTEKDKAVTVAIAWLIIQNDLKHFYQKQMVTNIVETIEELASSMGVPRPEVEEVKDKKLEEEMLGKSQEPKTIH